MHKQKIIIIIILIIIITIIILILIAERYKGNISIAPYLTVSQRQVLCVQEIPDDEIKQKILNRIMSFASL